MAVVVVGAGPAGVACARELAAAFFGCSPHEILFTGGGSESDNLALRGVMWALREPGDHLITTAVEHHAVLYTARALERQGFRVTYLQPDRWGRVSVEQVAEAITRAGTSRGRGRTADRCSPGAAGRSISSST